MKIEFKWDRGMQRMRRAVDPARFQEAMNRHVPRATMLNAHLVQKEIRETIRSGLFHPNAALTIAIKRSSKPLVDTGHGLFQAVNIEQVNDYKVFVGVLKSDDFYNVAIAIHDGATVKVSEKMRGMFYVLWKASTGQIPPSELTGRAAELWSRKPGGWLPLKQSTTAIIIPARPFMVKAFSNPELRAMVQRNWHAALAASFRDLAP